MTVQSEGEISSVSSFVSASVPVFVSAALTIVCVCECPVSASAIQVDTHAHCGKQTGLKLQQSHGYTIRIYRERGIEIRVQAECVCVYV